MKQHPVPQNVIDVEFKLFGSFTLKQFSKVLGGGIIGAIVFVLPLPFLVKLPIVAFCVLAGFGMAVIPNLGVWLAGFFKSLLISPRYVWVRSSTPPDILKVTQTLPSKSGAAQSNVSKNLQSTKIDLNEVDLKSIYSKTKVVKKENLTETNIVDNNISTEENFTRVYEDVFGGGILSPAQDSPLNSLYKQEFNKPNVTNITKEQRIENYKSEIKDLKYKLSLLEKNADFKRNEELILAKINDIYREIKILENNSGNLTSTNSVNKTQVLNAKGVSIVNGKIINGIVVTKKDVPIPSCVISFIDKQKNVIYRTRSNSDGKFSTGSAIPNATYTVVIEHSLHRFFNYLIEVKDSNLPAFKFREK